MILVCVNVCSQLQQESKSVSKEDKKNKEISNMQFESAIESQSPNRTESSPIESWSTKDPLPSSGEWKIPDVISSPIYDFNVCSWLLG